MHFSFNREKPCSYGKQSLKAVLSLLQCNYNIYHKAYDDGAVVVL